MYFGTGGAAFLTDIAASIFLGSPCLLFILSLAIVSGYSALLHHHAFESGSRWWRSPPPLRRHHQVKNIFFFSSVKKFSFSEFQCFHSSNFIAALLVVISQSGCTCDHDLPATLLAISFR